MTTPPASRPPRIAAALLASLLSACATANLGDIYRITGPLTDTETNVEVWAWQWRSPGPACERLDLPPDVRTWLEARSDHRPSPAPFIARGAPRTIINTDVDDTVIAKFWDRDRYERDRVYPGVLELLAAQGDALVVLTARSWGQTGLRDEFCSWFHPRRSSEADCRGIDVSLGRTQNLVDSLGMGLVKAEALLRQIKAHPEASVAFNGDSGQGDWIAALIARDLAGERMRYAAIHDVRPWSLEHRIALRNEIAESEDLERIYRDELGLPAGALSPAERARLDHRLGKIRGDVAATLTGPGGRLNGEVLRARGIFLHRSYAALALDLADARLIDQDDADAVLRKAVPELCFAPENSFGFDDSAERERLVDRLAARAAARPPPGSARE